MDKLESRIWKKIFIFAKIYIMLVKRKKQSWKSLSPRFGGKGFFRKDLHNACNKEEAKLEKLESRIWRKMFISAKIYIMLVIRKKQVMKRWGPGFGVKCLFLQRFTYCL